MWIWLYALLLGCQAHFRMKGLLFQPSSEMSQVWIGSSEGRKYRLHLGEDASYFPYLNGCVADVTAKKFGRHLWVEEWKITDAGDGSAPFLGMVFRDGLDIKVNDVNSGQAMLLLGDWDFTELIGKAVLVTGIVVGPHQLQVMNLKVLE